jgi:hypothetical protein
MRAPWPGATVAPGASSVLGIARRLPGRSARQYRHTERAAGDIAAEGTATTVARLTEQFRGADAVVHLAWLVQPDRERDLLRRTTVEGTRRVAEDVARQPSER